MALTRKALAVAAAAGRLLMIIVAAGLFGEDGLDWAMGVAEARDER
jgi:hypothetical protein